jgi:F-type H+-transporting ATPase subunit gamma
VAEAERLKRRLDTAETVWTVVRTMKALAALRIRQYQRAAAALRGYDRTIELGFTVLLRHHPELLALPPHATTRAAPPICVVLPGTDHGLCGTFNERLAAFAGAQLQLLSGDERPLLLVIGRRLVPALQREGFGVAETLEPPSGASGITPVVERSLLVLDGWRERHGSSSVFVMHQRLGEGGVPQPRARQLTPLDRRWLQSLADTAWPGGTLPTFRSETEALFQALSRQRLVTSLQRALADSLAAENSARLAAMQAAERNIEEHVHGLERDLRRERQERITAELLEIQAGTLS